MTVAVASSVYRLPASKSLSEMQREVLDFVTAINDPDLQRAATGAINLGIDRLNMEIWNDIVGLQDFTWIAGTAAYPLSAHVRKPRRLDVHDTAGSPKSVMKWLPFDEFSLRFPVFGVESMPSYYTFSHETRELLLNNSPSTAWVGTYPTSRMYFHRAIAHMNSPNDQLLAPSNYAAYVTWYASAKIAATRAPQKYAIARSERDDIWLSLRRDNTEQFTDWSSNG